MTLPKFDSRSLEELLIALVHLKDEQGLKVRIAPCDVFNEEMLKQIPPPLRGRPSAFLRLAAEVRR